MSIIRKYKIYKLTGHAYNTDIEYYNLIVNLVSNVEIVELMSEIHIRTPDGLTLLIYNQNLELVIGGDKFYNLWFYIIKKCEFVYNTSELELFKYLMLKKLKK